ncbi:MAG TPA: PhzF family phenazine biosynthesis isomerase, partial [Alphaproteobacteria bacterium]|nr:PhzF family phenazine biosynthesis isomerase [Alphaproteobacteria bacterium]
MPQLDFMTADVFTDRRFGGNSVAVFPAPTELSAETMQALSRELNLSETVFVQPGAGLRERALRIFTPAREVPFAGHPIVGTAVILASEGLFGTIDGSMDVLFKVEAGAVPVKIKRLGELLHAEFTAPQLPHSLAGVPARENIARVVSLDEERLARGVAAASYSCGLPFVFVPVANRAALANARIDPAAFERYVAPGPAKEVYVLSMEDWQHGR